MSEGIKKEIESWATSNNLKIDMEQINNASLEDRFEFNQPLAYSLQEAGYWRDSYEGMDPEHFLPDLINGILAEVSDSKITVSSLSSDDNWQSAKLVLSNNGKTSELNINDVGGYDLDYAPPEIYNLLEDYVKENCSGALKGVFSPEGGYVYFYISKDAANELKDILNKIPQPEY